MKKVFLFLGAFLFLTENLALAGLSEKRLRKHFDFNGDGRLSAYEQSLIKTYRRFQWPLAVKKRKPFDSNRNGMLEPIEYQNYLRAKQKKT